MCADQIIEQLFAICMIILLNIMKLCVFVVFAFATPSSATHKAFARADLVEVRFGRYPAWQCCGNSPKLYHFNWLHVKTD